MPSPQLGFGFFDAVIGIVFEGSLIGASKRFQPSLPWCTKASIEPSGEIATGPSPWPRFKPLSTSSTLALEAASCARATGAKTTDNDRNATAAGTQMRERKERF